MKLKLKFETFLNACEKGDLVTVVLYARLGMDYKQENNKALQVACENGHLEIVKYLTSTGIYPNPEGVVPYFLETSKRGHVKVVKYLTQRQHIEEHVLQMAFEKALEGGHIPMIQFWLDKGVVLQNDVFDCLDVPCEMGKLELLEYLVEKCGKKVIVNHTHLEKAIKNEHYAVVQYLLNQGCDLLKCKVEVQEIVLKKIEALNIMNGSKNGDKTIENNVKDSTAKSLMKDSILNMRKVSLEDSIANETKSMVTI
jgi:ankyrin repeat protein